MKARVCTLEELGPDLVLAPERHVQSRAVGIPLGGLVRERGERVHDLGRAIVLDTTHVKDGLVDLRAAAREGAAAKSVKKLALPGDLLLSRLRPYLRQIALVPRCTREIAVSSEFYVLESVARGDLAWLLPVLLGEAAQRMLASAQEGGHHPRVPRASLFALTVPHDDHRRRNATSRAVRLALDAHYRAARRLEVLFP